MSQHLFIPPLPDLGEVKQAIAKFLDASKFNECRETDSPEEFLRSIRQELGILERTFMLLISRPVPLGDQRFYRLRFPKEPLEDFSQHRFGPPPPEFAPFDRCSIKRHPVMYTSANPATCFQEVLFLQPDQIPMQVGYLSEWKAKNGCEFKVVPFVYHELSKASDLHPVVEDVRAMVTNQLAQYYDETRCQGVLATLEYLSR
ncbi:MAG: hypothetical protein RBT71_09490, partial [Flavobacteriales bacterium]|nr:hypothetical protein [Flavobacteriales bacterium]